MVSLVRNCRVVRYHLDGLEVVEKDSVKSYHQRANTTGVYLEILEEPSRREADVTSSASRGAAVNSNFNQLELFTSSIMP